MTLFTVPHGALVAYDESSQSGTITEDQETVARRRENYDLLRAMALSPRDSEAMILFWFLMGIAFALERILRDGKPSLESSSS